MNTVEALEAKLADAERAAVEIRAAYVAADDGDAAALDAAGLAVLRADRLVVKTRAQVEEARRAAEQARRAELEQRLAELAALDADETVVDALATRMRAALATLQSIRDDFQAEEAARRARYGESLRCRAGLGEDTTFAYSQGHRPLIRDVRPAFQRGYTSAPEIRALRDALELANDLTEHAR